MCTYIYTKYRLYIKRWVSWAHQEKPQLSKTIATSNICMNITTTNICMNITATNICMNISASYICMNISASNICMNIVGKRMSSHAHRRFGTSTYRFM